VRGEVRINAKQLESQAHLSSIVESALDAIIAVDSDQRIVLFNSAAESMFGCNSDEALGQPLDNFLPPRFRQAHRNYVVHYGKTNQPARPMADGQVLMGLRRDGTEFPIEAVISQLELEGQKVYTAFIRDVSEQKHAANQLERMIWLLRATLESTADGIIVLDSTGRVITFNKKYLEIWNLEASMLDHGNDDAVPAALLQLKDPESVLKSFIEVMADPELIWRDEIEFLDGRIIERYSQPRYFDEHTLGRVWSFRDVTERKAAEAQQARLQAQLLQAQKLEAIGTLAGGIAHDFNNVLYGIKGYGELVQSSLDPGSQAYLDMAEVLGAAQRAEDLVRQILTFCRKGVARRVPVGLPTIVKEVTRLMRSTQPSTIEVKQVLEVGDATVIADPVEVHQVLLNLCTNAGQAMADNGGTLEIGLRRFEVDPERAELEGALAPGHYFLLSVSDTGPGIADDVMERIFEPFFTTKDVGDGTGLGLSIVHGVVSELGGKVTVYSEPGNGTEFHVYLPAADRSEERSALDEPRRGGERVLFVDDEPSISRLGKKALESLGYKVEEYNSSFEALERFTSAPREFDIVVTDETMPKLRGSELAQLIQGLRPDLPVILCTGYSQRLESQSLPASIKQVLHKPLTRRDLSAAIRAVLDGPAQ
jgi:PAS domain S-box-containing protein